jgi:hypothetical protein
MNPSPVLKILGATLAGIRIIGARPLGAEIFYIVALTPWFRVTANPQ